METTLTTARPTNRDELIKLRRDGALAMLVAHIRTADYDDIKRLITTTSVTTGNSWIVRFAWRIDW